MNWATTTYCNVVARFIEPNLYGIWFRIFDFNFHVCYINKYLKIMKGVYFNANKNSN